jgi:polyketide cyclase/dehydrase/lipid transport protein
MPQHAISAAALIPSSPQQVYSIIADYCDGHPRILPKPHFVSLIVEQGGVGAGTVIRFQMRLMGRNQTFRAAITEPEPGRVLVETDLQTGATTTFVVEPRDDARHAEVTITTMISVREGLLGGLEAWLTTRLLRPIYIRELVQLADVATKA